MMELQRRSDAEEKRIRPVRQEAISAITNILLPRHNSNITWEFHIEESTIEFRNQLVTIRRQ